jgi:mannose-6-phosphate isomerase
MQLSLTDFCRGVFLNREIQRKENLYMSDPFKLIPEYRDYVWGGERLRPGQLTAEAWVVYEQDRISGGNYNGQTLLETAGQLGAALLGSRVVERTGQRFPLLIKLLDCADWLSLQVHPNDEQARKLEGPDQFGKTEAWHILSADPGAELLFGLKAGVTAHELEASVRDGSVLERVARHSVQPGDTVFIRPGMIHALGPGLLIYEVQQTSNITYRVWDWDRPASAGRKLHIRQSLEVLDPSAEAKVLPRPALETGQRQTLAECPYFTLEMIRAGGSPVALETTGETFHILTATFGSTNLCGEGWETSLEAYESLVIPADCGVYQVNSQQGAVILKASVE